MDGGGPARWEWDDKRGAAEGGAREGRPTKARGSMESVDVWRWMKDPTGVEGIGCAAGTTNVGKDEMLLRPLTGCAAPSGVSPPSVADTAV